MDLKCLLKLLLEKEIIKVEETAKANGKTVMKAFRYKYDEVFEKILASNYSKEIIKIGKSPNWDNRKKIFYVLNVENLNYGLKVIGEGREKFMFNKSHKGLHHIPDQTFKNLIANYTDFDIINIDNFGERTYYTLRDSEIHRKKCEEKEKEKKEVLDFLNQLP